MTGMLGMDSFGDFLIHDFKHYGLDTSHILRDSATSLSVVLSDQVTHGRNILHQRTTARSYTVEDIDEAFIASHDLLHLEAANPVSHRLADIIHAASGRVAFDGDQFLEATQQMLPKIDIFIGSEFYYNGLFGASGNYEANLEKVREIGPSIAVFTFGDKGSAVKWEGGYAFVPGYKVEVVDTVGAGDVYHGAFLFALAKGMEPPECAQFANAVAAIKCTTIGGRAGVPNYEMTVQFMQTGTYDRSLIEEKLLRYRSLGKTLL